MSSHHTHVRARGGYPSNLSQREWIQLAGLVKRTGGPGRPPIHSRRAIVDAIRYLVRTGCPWRYLPKEFPPWKSVYWNFCHWQKTRLLEKIHDHLRKQCRALAGRPVHAHAASIDSQSVRAADTVHKDSRGWDNGKKVNGRKRHVIVDTQGLLITVAITPANTHDATAAITMLPAVRSWAPAVSLIWADTAYQGKRLANAAQNHGINIQVVHKLVDQTTFIVLHRRWVVERTLAWISKHRRCARDYETKPDHQTAMIHWASTSWMLTRLSQK